MGLLSAAPSVTDWAKDVQGADQPELVVTTNHTAVTICVRR